MDVNRKQKARKESRRFLLHDIRWQVKLLLLELLVVNGNEVVQGK